MDGWLKVTEITAKLQEGRAEDPVLGVNIVVLVVKVNAIAEGSRPRQQEKQRQEETSSSSSLSSSTARESSKERTAAVAAQKTPAHLCTAHVTVGDETGTVALVVTGRNRISLLDTLMQCGTAAVVRGARVRVFRSRVQLCLERGSGSLRSFTFQGDGAGNTRRVGGGGGRGGGGEAGEEMGGGGSGTATTTTALSSSWWPPEPRVAPARANKDPGANISAIRWVAVQAKPLRMRRRDEKERRVEEVGL